MKNLCLTILLSTMCCVTDITNWTYYQLQPVVESSHFESEFSSSKVLLSKNNKFNVITIKKGSMDFGVSLERPKNCDFYMNSNFFSEEPIGLVVINGKRHSSRVKGGGYFYVKNGKPYVRSRECPSYTTFASQTILWGINNKKVNYSLIGKSHAKKKTYRTIMGQNKEGDIVIVASKTLGITTIEEIINVGLEYGMIDGILFDGGTSVEYTLKDGKHLTSFKALSDVSKVVVGIDRPMTYIYGNFK